MRVFVESLQQFSSRKKVLLLHFFISRILFQRVFVLLVVFLSFYYTYKPYRTAYRGYTSFHTFLVADECFLSSFSSVFETTFLFVERIV